MNTLSTTILAVTRKQLTGAGSGAVENRRTEMNSEWSICRSCCVPVSQKKVTCIAGSIAEAFYGVPEEMKAECRKRLPEDMLQVVDRFDEAVLSR